MMKKLKYLIKNKKGTSLVEVIGSLGILSILFVFLTSVIGMTLVMINNSLKINKANNNAVSGMENKISNSKDDSGNSVVTDSDGNMVIVFTGGGDSKEVDINSKGKVSKSADSKSQSSFYYYTPQDSAGSY